ncbi:hypothetical protein ACIQMR_31445 [Streptomyces sp. NPDC091376]
MELFLLPGWVDNPPQPDAARRDVEALVRFRPELYLMGNDYYSDLA